VPLSKTGKAAGVNKRLQSVLWIAMPAALAGLLWLGSLFLTGAPFDAPAFPKDSLAIKRAGGGLAFFTVEVAATPVETSYGLMFRRSLPEDSGMLFLFQPDQIISMWMKNTYIPLDMLFVRRDGVIVKIVTHTEPFSLTTINSDELVKGVIEIGGGVAAKKGINTGDIVLYPAFAPAP
jgi:uncharacterized membrane protein (UPF0127 family)